MNQPDSPQIRALKERYRTSLVDKIVLLKDQRSTLHDDSIDSLAKVFEILHKLAGSSGMYGYDDVSAACRDTMAMTDKAQVIDHLDALIELLEQHC